MYDMNGPSIIINASSRLEKKGLCGYPQL